MNKEEKHTAKVVDTCFRYSSAMREIEDDIKRRQRSWLFSWNQLTKKDVESNIIRSVAVLRADSRGREMDERAAQREIGRNPASGPRNPRTRRRRAASAHDFASGTLYGEIRASEHGVGYDAFRDTF